MGHLLSYSLTAGLYLAVAYGAYRVLLAGARQARFNRVVLLSIYVVALIAPIALPALTTLYGRIHPSEAAGIVVGLPTIEAVSMEPTEASKWLLAAAVSYIVGLVIVSLRSIYAIVGLIRIARRAEREEHEGYTLLIVDGCEVPFSFMRYIAAGRGDLGDESGFILTHELAHIRLRHWLDLFLAQAICCVMWYNPAAWLMRAELRRIHEYQADEAVMAAGLPLRPYQELLIKKAAGVRLQSIANSLNHSNITKRITMMYQKPSRRMRRLASLAMLPAVALTAVLVRQPAVASTLAAISSVDTSAPSVSAIAVPAEAQTVSQVAVSEADAAAPAPAVATTTTATAMTPDAAPVRKMDITDMSLPYKGGLDALLSQLVATIHYPSDAQKAGAQGKVVVSFTVTAKGEVVDPKVVKSVYPSLDEEAVRAICALPGWTPPVNENGKPFDAEFFLPVKFSLTGESCKIPEKDNKTVVNINGQPVIDLSKAKPDIYIDGTLYTGDIQEINPETIQAISVRKDDPAHPNGIVDITLKK